jgi:hypothetical protein
MNKTLLTLLLALAAMLGMGALTNGALAQGLISFANGPTTLISISTNSGAIPTPYAASPPGSYYFGLLTATSTAGPFTFTGVYATNTADAGRFGPASYTPTVPGWAPGATMFYEVFGWSASFGATFNTNWIIGNTGANPNGFLGFSAVASGVAGGNTPQAKLSVSISGESIVISWTATGGTLQSSPSLGAGETWSTVGTANPATVTNSGNAMFFRVVPVVYPTPELFGPSRLQGFILDYNGPT